MERVDFDAEPSKLTLGQHQLCCLEHELAAEDLGVAEELLEAGRDLAHRRIPFGATTSVGRPSRQAGAGGEGARQLKAPGRPWESQASPAFFTRGPRLRFGGGALCPCPTRAQAEGEWSSGRRVTPECGSG